MYSMGGAGFTDFFGVMTIIFCREMYFTAYFSLQANPD